jgi:hypothetical protein
MAVGTIMPLPRFTGFDANGNPVPNGQLWTYVAGTSTPATTYTDVGLTIPHANPIRLNSAGRPASGGSELGVYLTPGSSYKFVLQDANGATLWTQDNVAAVPTSSLSVDVVGSAGENLMAYSAVFLSDGTGGRTAGSWYLTDSDAAATSTQPRQVGVTIANIAAGTQGVVRLEGALIIPGAGFTPGATYYVHSVAGQLSASVAQTFLRAVGVAQDVQTIILGVGAGAAAAGGITFSSPLTGLQHNLAIPAGCAVLYVTTPLQLTGIAAGVPGQSLTIINTGGSGQVDFLHLNGGSSAGNRLSNIAQSAPTSLGVTGSAHYLYDGALGFWRLQQHEQGAWLDTPYSASNYSGSGSMTWAVSAGQQTFNRYVLNGRTLQWLVYIEGATLAGTASTQLYVRLPGAFVGAAKRGVVATAQCFDGTTRKAWVRIHTDTINAAIEQDPAGPFALNTNTTYIEFLLTVEIN